MKFSIDIQVQKGNVTQETCTRLMGQILSFAHEAHLFSTEISACCGLQIIINPEASSCFDTNQISDKLHWKLYTSHMTVSVSARNDFLLQCLNLDIRKNEGINSILIIMTPSNVQTDSTATVSSSNVSFDNYLLTFIGKSKKTEKSLAALNELAKQQNKLTKQQDAGEVIFDFVKETRKTGNFTEINIAELNKMTNK